MNPGKDAARGTSQICLNLATSDSANSTEHRYPLPKSSMVFRFRMFCTRFNHFIEVDLKNLTSRRYPNP